MHGTLLIAKFYYWIMKLFTEVYCMHVTHVTYTIGPCDTNKQIAGASLLIFIVVVNVSVSVSNN